MDPTLMVLIEELVYYVEDTSTAPEEESEVVPPSKKAKGLAAILEKMPGRALVSTSLLPNWLIKNLLHTWTYP